jgi:peptidoglycan/LPS O-acetylase OafA/YrhL
MPVLLSMMLEACRWIGALLVLAVHATNCFVNLGDIMTAPHAAPVYGWWFFVSYELGHQAVLGFFVMSGYLVGGAALSSMLSGKKFLREYFIHRFARIYIVVVPALIFTFLCDSFGRNFLPNASFYDQPLFHGHWSAAIFVANLFSLQEIHSVFYGTNGPLWSLACEFWYYITFPLLIAPLALHGSRLIRYGSFSLGVAIFLAMAVAPWFRFGYLLWVIGALASLPSRPLIASRWTAIGIYVAALIPIRLLVRGPLLAAHPWLQDAADLLGSVLFANVILTMRHAPDQGWALLRSNLHRALADFSFSLYSIHMPMLILLRAVADSYIGSGWAVELATPAHWAYLAAAMGMTIGVAYGFSRLTEVHTGAARRYLRNALPPLTQAVS